MNARLRFSLLSFTAGFADTTTFLGLNGLFSAHVTGSLMLLAVSFGHGWRSTDIFKLLALPVFAVTALFAECFRSRFACAQWLSLEANLLMVAAIFGLFTSMHPHLGFEFGVAFCAVTGMALQTYLGRIHPAEYGLTTIMTNNLVQIMINLARGKGDVKARHNLLNDLARLTGFVMGCVIGAFLTHWFGMVGFALPALLVIFVAEGSSSIEVLKTAVPRSSDFTPQDSLRSEVSPAAMPLRRAVGETTVSNPVSAETVVLPPERWPTTTSREPRISGSSRPS